MSKSHITITTVGSKRLTANLVWQYGHAISSFVLQPDSISYVRKSLIVNNNAARMQNVLPVWAPYVLISLVHNSLNSLVNGREQMSMPLPENVGPGVNNDMMK